MRRLTTGLFLCARVPCRVVLENKYDPVFQQRLVPATLEVCIADVDSRERSCITRGDIQGHVPPTYCVFSVYGENPCGSGL